MVDAKEMHTFTDEWDVYGLAVSARPDKPYRFAIGSFIEDYCNKVRLVRLDDNAEWKRLAVFDHPYPATKVQFVPDTGGTHADLLATTGDYLRLWSIKDEADSTTVDLKQFFNANKNSEFCAPLTCCDWNRFDLDTVAVGSIDTTVTVWDITSTTPKTQIIAHDKEVFDVSFNSPTVFASCSGDGSVRLFDTRNLEHSTILFETGASGSKDMRSLLRVQWNKLEMNLLATIALDSDQVALVDVRMPGVPVSILSCHDAAVNGVAWAPHSDSHLCTVGDDSQALIWDIISIPKPVEDPILAYTAPAAINTVAWPTLHTDWVAITFNQSLQFLRV